jgi:hypothetical protein
MRHASRSSGLLHVEVSWVRVSQFASKMAEVRQQVVHVASSWRSREDRVKEGRVNAMGCDGPCYLCFAVFFVLCPRGILVFQSFSWAYFLRLDFARTQVPRSTAHLVFICAKFSFFSPTLSCLRIFRWQPVVSFSRLALVFGHQEQRPVFGL